MSAQFKHVERRFAQLLGGHRRWQGQPGSDVDGTPWSVEIKYSKRGVPEGRWIAQACEQSRRERKPWLLIVVGHNQPWRKARVVMEFDEFQRLAQIEDRMQ